MNWTKGFQLLQHGRYRGALVAIFGWGGCDFPSCSSITKSLIKPNSLITSSCSFLLSSEPWRAIKIGFYAPHGIIGWTPWLLSQPEHFINFSGYIPGSLLTDEYGFCRGTSLWRVTACDDLTMACNDTRRVSVSSLNIKLIILVLIPLFGKFFDTYALWKSSIFDEPVPIDW